MLRYSNYFTYYSGASKKVLLPVEDDDLGYGGWSSSCLLGSTRISKSEGFIISKELVSALQITFLNWFMLSLDIVNPAAFIWFFISLEAQLLGPRHRDRLSPVSIIGDGL